MNIPGWLVSAICIFVVLSIAWSGYLTDRVMQLECALAEATKPRLVARDGDVGGDIFFPPEPPAGYQRFSAATVVLNAAGDSLFVCFETSELWQVAPPWCDVVPR